MNLEDKTMSTQGKALFAALTCLLYVVIQSFAISSVPFPADDMQELAFVNGFQSWTQLFGKDVFGLFRPVKNLLFLLLSCFPPNDISGFRLVCICIGILSYIPVLGLCRRVFDGKWSAFSAAAVWLLAPTIVSSVAWLSCVNIQIMAGIAALALCMHDKGQTLLASTCLFFGCVSYESAVAIGPVIVAYDFFLRPGRLRTLRAWKAYAVYAVVTATYLLLRWGVGSASSVNGSLAGLSRTDLIGASAYFTLQHFGIWLWPFGNMAVFGGYAAGQVPAFGHFLCWLLVVAVAVSAFALRNRAPRVAFGIAMAFLAFLPTSNILGIGNGPYGDYYLDVTSIGLSILLVAVSARLLSVSGRFARIVGAFGAVLLLVRICAIAESARWAYLWADGERAYKSTIATFPKAYYCYIVYAQMLCDRDDFAGALSYCDDAERLIGSDEEKMRHINIVRAICVMRGEKDAQKALALLDKCENGCSRASLVRSCHFYRGCVAEDLMNDVSFAQREYEAAMPAMLGSEDIRTADRLARLYAINGKVPAAIELWRQALRVSPGDYSVTWNLSIALRQTGAIDEANRLQGRIDGGVRCPQ